MARKYFSNTAVATTLSTSISDADTSLTVNSSTGYPAVPFTIAINPGTSSEEIIKVAAKSGTTFSSLSRGYDNTTARAHTSGASIKHVAAAEDFDALYTHSHATSDGHTNIPIANVTGTVPTTKGGTGLTSLGSAKQVLKVNDAGNALEYGNAEAILNIDGMTDGSGITIADTDDFAISDGGVEKKVNASQIKAYTQHTDEEIEDVVGGMLDGDESFIEVTYDDTDGNIDFTVATKDEDNMSSNSATHLPTQQSVKAYVDTHAALNTHLTLVDEDDFSSNSATSVPSQQSVKAYVDNQTLSLIDEDNFSTNSATRPPSQQSVKAYVDTHAALGTHLTLIDEDNFSTDSATQVPSQQSVKAYVDTHAALGTHLTLIDEDDMSTNSATRPPSQQSVKAYVDGQTLSLIDEDDMASNSATRPPSQQSVKAYVDGASVSSEQVEDIVGAMFSSNTETGITATYVDNASGSGKINLEVSASSDAITEGDSDFTITDTGTGTGIHYEIDNTDMADWNRGGIALTTAGGTFRHHQTQAATYTIGSSEGAVMAGPIEITGTITNQGTLVVL